MPAMRAAELLKEIDEFRDLLVAHHETLGRADKSLKPPHVAKAELNLQTSKLTRALGKLRPFIEIFDDQWIMRHPATGVQWDILSTAVSTAEIPQKKYPSLSHAIDKLNTIAGTLEALPDDHPISTNETEQMPNSRVIDQLMVGYLPHLHPRVADGCAKLFSDGHYVASIEHSAKVVFQHLRDVTGLTLDGAALAQQVFRTKNPLLTFSDLSDESKQNEQIGFMNLLEAYYKGVRNPIAHTHGKTEDAQKAFEYLVMASLLCRRIDDATPPG